MKKIAITIHEKEKLPSGVLTLIKEFSNFLPSDYFLYLITNSDNWLVKEFNCYFKKNNIKIITIPNKLIDNKFSIIAFVKILFNLYNIFKKNEIKHLFSHSGGWPGGRLNRLSTIAGFILKLKTNVLVIHNFPIGELSFFKKYFFKIYAFLISILATDLVTVSNSCRDALIQYGFMKKIKVIYNGIGGLNHKNKIKKTDRKSQSFSVGFLGEISPRKGIHLILDACQDIKNNLTIKIAGNSNDNSYKKLLINKAKLSNHDVSFLGYLRNTDNFYNNINVLILPSVSYESFGLVLIEAMSKNIPVICSDFGGMTEVVIHEKTGLVFKNGSAKDLCQNILRLMNSSLLSLKLTKKAKKFVYTNFNSISMSKKYLELISS